MKYSRAMSLNINLKFHAEGTILEMGGNMAGNKPFSGTYALSEETSLALIDILSNIVNTADPVIGDKFMFRDKE